MARREVGMAWTWGEGSVGNLGDGSTNDVSSPVSVAHYARYSKLSLGITVANEQRSAAIDSSSGMIYTWGNNTQGALGNNSINDTSSPVSIARPGSYTNITVGYWMMAAIDSSGNIWTWGRNTLGQLGDGTANADDLLNQSSPVSIIRPGSYVAVSAGQAILAIDGSDGMIWAWGHNNHGELGNDSTNNASSPVSIVRPGSYTAITAAFTTAAAIDGSTGMIYTWGENDFGGMGNDSTNDESSPVAIARPGSYIAVSVGYGASAAIDSSGMIWTWGLNSSGQLGNDSTIYTSSPVSIARPGSYIKIASGRDSIVALDSDGVVWTWGKGANGRLGNDSTNNQSSPVSIAKGGKYFDVAAGRSFAGALRFLPMNYFDSVSISDGIAVTSNLDQNEIVGVIADNITDTYFDSTNEIVSVETKYVHEDGRQKKVVLHSGPSLTGQASWSSLTRDGTWQKTEITVRDSVGASRTLTRDQIGSGEDLTHSDGTMNLNV